MSFFIRANATESSSAALRHSLEDLGTSRSVDEAAASLPKLIIRRFPSTEPILKPTTASSGRPTVSG